jgi:hypothetical protein
VIAFTLADNVTTGGGIVSSTDIVVTDSLSGSLTPTCTGGDLPSLSNGVVHCTVTISGAGSHSISVVVTDRA